MFTTHNVRGVVYALVSKGGNGISDRLSVARLGRGSFGLELLVRLQSIGPPNVAKEIVS